MLEEAYADHSLIVDGDATRLAQVLGNLFSNAIKATPPGGTITVAVSEKPEQEHVEVSIRDTGIGLEPEQLRHLFEPFVLASRSHGQSGLGLGLPLAHGVVALHGGTLEAESGGPGRGAKFTIRLALASGRSALPASAPEAAQVSPISKDVLIIEDNTDAALALRDALELAGHRAWIASDGRSGIALAMRLEPQVVLCDLGLPGEYDGLAVARRLRATPQLNTVRLIAVTAWAGPSDRARTREAGFDGHLAKPTRIEDVLRSISAA